MVNVCVCSRGVWAAGVCGQWVWVCGQDVCVCGRHACLWLGYVSDCGVCVLMVCVWSGCCVSGCMVSVCVEARGQLQ